ncbi:MAG: glutathione S-transferase [Gammaproteobacteria bacterium]|jgi:glutathione S-transferase
MIKVFGFPQTRSRRITWMLEELGEDYEFILVDFNKGEAKSEAYLTINPAGKVPAMQDGELLLTESAAILTYLGDKFPDKELVPAAGTAERGKFEQWSYFTLSELEQALWTMGKHRFALPKERRVPDIIETAEWEFQCALKLLEQGLGDNQYILGDNFSGADILLAHTLIWGINFKQNVDQKNLQGYIERMRAREALVRAIAKEEASIK